MRFYDIVCAPKEERIARVMRRDSVSREAVLARMNHQWSDAKKRTLADAVIENTNLEEQRINRAAVKNSLKDRINKQFAFFCSKTINLRY